MPPVECERFALKRACGQDGAEKSPPEKSGGLLLLETSDQCGVSRSCYIAFTFMATSAGTQGFHTSPCAFRNSAATSAPSAWFSSM